MNKIFVLSLLFLAASCLDLKEEPSELRFFQVKKEDFKPYVNKIKKPAIPNLSELKTIINLEYPIEIALFQDGTWYYDLPNLDTGSGTWTFENGAIKLFAERNLFDMVIWLEATKEKAKDVRIRFSDRWGPKVFSMDKRNIELPQK